MELDYKGNSFREKGLTQNDISTDSETKKTEAVANGSLKKKGPVASIKEDWDLEDGNVVKNYILDDVLKPGIKDIIFKILTNSVSMILFKDTKHSNPSSNNVFKYSYKECSNINSNSTVNSKKAISYDEIIFSSRGEAERVLASMDDIIDRYKMVSVADYFDLSGVTNNNYTANNYGWTNLKTAHPVRNLDGGYSLSLPRPMPL